jgi:CheY-like chemotaxis protein
MTADSSSQQRLLIVEDDVHMAYLLGYLAEKERFAVETIADGRKARERIDAGARTRRRRLPDEALQPGGTRRAHPAADRDTHAMKGTFNFKFRGVQP